MDKVAFRHVIQAAAAVVDDELVIVGSQAVLGSIDDPPASLIRSQEVDLYPLREPGRAIEIDRALGDGSRFHQTHGYYAHGVGPETITAPPGWEGRLIRLEVPPIRCLSLPDLMLAKLAAGREHDVQFVRDALADAIVTRDELERGIDLMAEAVREAVRERLLFAARPTTSTE